MHGGGDGDEEIVNFPAKAIGDGARQYKRAERAAEHHEDKDMVKSQL
jgi:hypothetical protein